MRKVIFSLVTFLIFFSLSFPALATDPILPGGASLSSCGQCKTAQTDEACKQYCGDYKLNDFLYLAIKIANIILGLVGSLAFAMFIIGGVLMLISGGNKELVEKGRKTLINAVIGLIIVFSSYLIIKFTLTSLGVIDASGNINITTQSWTAPPTK